MDRIEEIRAKIGECDDIIIEQLAVRMSFIIILINAASSQIKIFFAILFLSYSNSMYYYFSELLYDFGNSYTKAFFDYNYLAFCNILTINKYIDRFTCNLIQFDNRTR